MVIQGFQSLPMTITLMSAVSLPQSFVTVILQAPVSVLSTRRYTIVELYSGFAILILSAFVRTCSQQKRLLFRQTSRYSCFRVLPIYYCLILSKSHQSIHIRALKTELSQSGNLIVVQVDSCIQHAIRSIILIQNAVS